MEHNKRRRPTEQCPPGGIFENDMVGRPFGRAGGLLVLLAAHTPDCEGEAVRQRSDRGEEERSKRPSHLGSGSLPAALRAPSRWREWRKAGCEQPFFYAVYSICLPCQLPGPCESTHLTAIRPYPPCGAVRKPQTADQKDWTWGWHRRSSAL